MIELILLAQAIAFVWDLATGTRGAAVLGVCAGMVAGIVAFVPG